VVAQEQHSLLQDGLLQEGQPGRRLAPHLLRDADALSQAFDGGAGLRAQHRFDLRCCGVRSLALGRRAEAERDVRPEQQLHCLVCSERDRRQVVARHEPVALTWHRRHGHAELRERVEVAIYGAHGAAALHR
jgi:hypothetical protein